MYGYECACVITNVLFGEILSVTASSVHFITRSTNPTYTTLFALYVTYEKNIANLRNWHYDTGWFKVDLLNNVTVADNSFYMVNAWTICHYVQVYEQNV